MLSDSNTPKPVFIKNKVLLIAQRSLNDICEKAERSETLIAISIDKYIGA